MWRRSGATRFATLRYMKVKTFGTVDARSMAQLERCMEAGGAELGVLCADHHPGYSQPIGGGIAFESHVSPSGVGFDIGCGNKAARTELTRADLDALGGVERLMAEITRRISFGMGVPARERTDHPVLERIRHAEFAPQRKLARLAESQLGTVGAGNHYVNLMEDQEGRVWVGVHFGSRGFGHKTATGFLALAQGLPFEGRPVEGGMDAPPVLFELGSELAESYIAAMELAGAYAYAGRDVVVRKVLEILGAEAVHEVHNHHNFAWREEHFGRTYWVVRKGCTPAYPGQEGFVGGTMGDESVILAGVAGKEAEESLFSTVHGAGRVMSRSQAAGRFRYRKRVVDGRTVRVRRAGQAGLRRLARRAGTAARAGHRPRRRRCGRGSGGVQAPAGRPGCPRRIDPSDAHPAPSRRGHGRAGRRGSLQGLDPGSRLARMSGLDDILGGLMGGQGGSGGLDSILGGLTGGGGQGGGGGGLGALVPVIGGLLASGGLQKILGGLKANGLSQQADSWVGTGQNEPVSGADMEKAVGKEQIQEVAKQLGVSESEAADVVAKAVPEVVDKVSPDGQLPPEQDLDAAFDKLAKAGAA